MATRLETLLVPVDFSACSDRALLLAQELAERLGARIVALHAVYLPTPVVAYAGDVVTDVVRLTDYAVEGAAEEMKGLLERLGLAGRVEARLRTGEPVRTILAEAREVGADLIVMGTHGRTGLSRLFMGSVADRVLRVSPVPVLTCRHHPGEPPWAFLDDGDAGEPAGRA